MMHILHFYSLTVILGHTDKIITMKFIYKCDGNSQETSAQILYGQSFSVPFSV